MREITRIHIAKVAYDIELDAKNDIENYIEALERYANDPGILDDIEIRITELFAEHGVAAGGVITKEDVAAVRAQLGEPSDFASDDEVGSSAKPSATGEEARRVYRDTNNAVVGGVLSGIARFFGVDSLWVRLGFIVVLLASFGTALIGYLILWLIIPPAETAADRLRMNGRAVTLASIKELVGSDEQQSKRGRAMQRVLGGALGLLLVLMAVSGLVAIIAVILGVQFGFGPGEIVPVGDRWIYGSWWFMTTLGLLIVSGLLFSALCFLLASAAFHRAWSRRVGVAVVTIIAAGLVVFASGVGISIYGMASEQARIDRLHQNTSGAVPANFSGITSFTFVDTGFDGPVPVQYIVSDNPRYELDAFPGIEPRFEITADGLSAKVKLVRTHGTAWSPFGSLGSNMTILRVYGPALSSVEAASPGSAVGYFNDAGQAELAVVMRSGSSLNLEGTYDTIHVTGDTYAAASFEKAAIGKLRIEGSGRVMAGVVRLLDVKQPDVCATHNDYDNNYFTQVQGISSGAFMYNGKEVPAKSITHSCGRVVIGDDEGSSNNSREGAY